MIVPDRMKFKTSIITINIVIEMINQRLLVHLSAKIPPNDVPITPATPLISNASDTNDISWPFDKISGLIYTNVTEFATKIKNVIIMNFATSAGRNTLDIT